MKKKIVVFVISLFGIISGYTVLEVFNNPDAPRSPASYPDNYDSLSACDKQEVLWEKIESSVHKQLPDYSKFGVIQLAKMGMQELNTKGDLHSDFAPADWKKYLHRRGSIAKVKIVPQNSIYTGIFQGADCALLRLSLTYKVKGPRPVAPGLALKVLRDKTHSANISALVSLEGQDKDFNFFKNPMSNIVPASGQFGQKLVHKIFNRYSTHPEELGVSEMASIDVEGDKTENAVSPRQLFFVPTGLNFRADEHDVRDDFATIPEGTVVYQIWALSDKHKDFDYSAYTAEQAASFLKESVHVADIVTTSNFVASEFGDEGIFFRHELRTAQGAK